MSNKLFISCPLSQLEPFVRSKVGYDILSFSCSGILIQYPGSPILEQLKELIYSENVSHITLVVDTDCKFLNAVREPANRLGLPTEKWIMDAFAFPLPGNFSDLSIYDQQLHLATQHVQEQGRQLYAALSSAFFLSDITLEIAGWVTTSRTNSLREIEFDFIKNKPHGF